MSFAHIFSTDLEEMSSLLSQVHWSKKEKKNGSVLHQSP